MPAAHWQRAGLGLRWPLCMRPFHHEHHPIDRRTHPQIRRIRRLHERAERERTGLYYVEGIRFVARAVQHGLPIEALVACRPLLTHPFARHLVRQQRRAGTPILDVTSDVFSSVSLADDPQGIGAVLRQGWTPLERLDPAEAACWVMLDTVRSPGNLGTMLRTSEAAGGAGLLLLGDAVDPYDPAAVRASMGALFGQRLVRTTVDAVRHWAARPGYRLVGATPDGATDYQTLDYHDPTVLLLGGERKGLSPELRALCDVTVRIPMAGPTDSLNLAIAASLLLYEVFNQRRRGVSQAG